jgi:hypothetical protein
MTKRKRVVGTVGQNIIAKNHGDGDIMETPRTTRRAKVDRARADTKAEAQVPRDPGGIRIRVKVNEVEKKEATARAARQIENEPEIQTVVAMKGVAPQYGPREDNPGRGRVHVHGHLHRL